MNKIKLTQDIINFLKNFKSVTYKDKETEKETVIYDVEQFYFITTDEEGVFILVNKYALLEVFMNDMKLKPQDEENVTEEEEKLEEVKTMEGEKKNNN